MTGQAHRASCLRAAVVVLGLAAALGSVAPVCARPSPHRLDSPAVVAELLVRARQISPGDLERSVRRDLTYAHLLGNPNDYRGQVLHVEGRLKRVHRLAPPSEAVRAGIKEWFEAWIFSESLGPNPWCVVFSEWPDNLPPEWLGRERIEGDHRASIDGYFVQKLRYTARNGNREAPLLVGRALRVSAGPNADARRPEWLRTGLLALFGWLFMPLLGLTWWFHRGDSRTRRRLSRAADFALPPADPRPIRSQGRRLKWLAGFARLAPPKSADSSGSDQRTKQPPAAVGGKRRTADPPAEEGAGARPRP
jgi:hypothetical protein